RPALIAFAAESRDVERVQSVLESALGEFQSHLAIALGVVAPVLAHLDEEKEVHRPLQGLAKLLARVGANRLDRGATLAEHDLALALALDKDRLLDPHRTVLALGPARGLDRRLVRQLLVQLAIDLLARDLGGE